MSNFICEKCGRMILDSPVGYFTGCEHYPETEGAREKVRRFINKRIRDLMVDQDIPLIQIDWHNVNCYKIEDGVAFIFPVSPYSKIFKEKLFALLGKYGIYLKDIKCDWIMSS